MNVVFDTNVVVSASFWHGTPYEALSTWARGEISVFVSPQLLAEYFRIFERLSARYHERKAVDWPTVLSNGAQLVFPEEDVRGAIKDPFDEMVLECGLAAKADFIVTGDKQHLLSLGEFRGIKIITCLEMLHLLRNSI